MSKNAILTIVMLVFLGASAYLIYQNFFATTGKFVPGKGFGQSEAQISANSVKILEGEVDKVNNELDPDGIWKTIEQNTVYNGLSDQALLDVEVGSYGQRPNPFLPIVYESQ